MSKQKLDEEEEETRGSAAQRVWEENWYELMPRKTPTQFVYHHHWRGLTEEQAKEWSEQQLLQTDHSVHGDLRLESNGVLHGWTIFLGTTEANREAGGDRLINLPEGDNLQVTMKLPQPKEWLKVGHDGPTAQLLASVCSGAMGDLRAAIDQGLVWVGKGRVAYNESLWDAEGSVIDLAKRSVSAPREVGATTGKWAVFFALDRGTYRLGVAKKHMFEYFLNGKKLKGRTVIAFAPVGEKGTRVWIIDRPKDQTPYAQAKHLGDVIKELRQKRQQHLVWSDGEKGPYFIDLKTDGDAILEGLEEGDDPWKVLADMAKSLKVSILKADSKHRYTLGVVYTAVDKKPSLEDLDAHGEYTTSDELFKASVDYVRSSDRTIYYHHGIVPSLGFKKAGEWVHLVQWPYPVEAELKLPGGRARKVTIPANSVYMGVIWEPEFWKLVEMGRIRGYSIGGQARRWTAD